MPTEKGEHGSPFLCLTDSDLLSLRILSSSQRLLLSSLTQHLYSPEIILYQAGVDVHQVDKLDYLALSDAGVRL